MYIPFHLKVYLDIFSPKLTLSIKTELYYFSPKYLLRPTKY